MKRLIGKKSIILLLMILLGNCLFAQSVALKRTPLHWAAKNGLNELVKEMIASGMNVNAVDHMHNTALHFAAPHPQTIEILLKAGASINQQNIFGNTPLHLAVSYYQSVQILLENGADKTLRNEIGYRPLEYSIKRGKSRRNQEIIKMLIP